MNPSKISVIGTSCAFMNVFPVVCGEFPTIMKGCTGPSKGKAPDHRGTLTVADRAWMAFAFPDNAASASRLNAALVSEERRSNVRNLGCEIGDVLRALGSTSKGYFGICAAGGSVKASAAIRSIEKNITTHVSSLIIRIPPLARPYMLKCTEPYKN